jgi:hypothetical protein
MPNSPYYRIFPCNVYNIKALRITAADGCGTTQKLAALAAVKRKKVS